MTPWEIKAGEVMNPLWIGILAIFVLAEKLGPHGPWLAYISGLVLLAWGAATLMVSAQGTRIACH